MSNRRISINSLLVVRNSHASSSNCQAKIKPTKQEIIRFSLFKKIETIAKELYRASEVVADTKIREQLKNFEETGYQSLPICIAKTQYSFSTDPNLKGAPSGHVLPIREVRLSSGAEFIVVVCGAIMTMPGLPKVPAADKIKINDKGETEGLF
jgi:formate--tetrahydrofolate ligase